jgi:hypothetical protein
LIDGKDNVSLNIIVQVSDHRGQVVAQKSKDLNFQLQPIQKDPSKNAMLRYQTSIELDPGVYGIHLIVWDNFSGKSGTRHQTFTAAKFGAGELASSDIVLASEMEEDRNIGPIPDSPGMMRQTLPSITKRTFRNGEEMQTILEIYNLDLHKETGKNSLSVEYQFLKGTQTVLSAPAFKPKPSAQKECLIQNSFRLKNFVPGEYVLRITITDELTAKSIIKETTFILAK